MSSVAEKIVFPPEISTRVNARTRAIMVAACPILFALIALLLGKATGWDLRNYHWYNPYGLLNDRLGFDIAVGHHASYYNPLADVPLFWIATHLPAWVGGVFLGAMAGVVVDLIGITAYFLIPSRNERQRLLSAAVIALIGASGAGALAAIGDPYNDIPAGLGSIAALCLLITRFEHLRRAPLDGTAVRTLLAAGICAGAAIGLKLTTAPYAVGLAVALVLMSGTPILRMRRALYFGIGGAIGVAIFGGYWMVKMWRYGGNPLFPYFNNIFHSPLLLDASYRDPNFHPDTWQKFLFFPFYFTANSTASSEQFFRDAHILAAYILVPITACIALVQRLRGRTLAGDCIDTQKAGFFFIFAGVAYAAWVAVFAIYRYLIPLEMLAPLLIVAAVLVWPIHSSVRLGVIGVVLLATLAVERVTIERDSWSGPYVKVGVPELQDPQHSMVLMSGYEPMAFVIPSFPKEIPFLRIDGWLAGADDRQSGLARIMHERVEAHTGPLYLLFSPIEREHAVLAVKGYDLSPALDTGCSDVKSNISDTLTLCRVYKLKPQ
jgi:hypothetical protein